MEDYTINDFLEDLIERLTKKFTAINNRLDSLQSRIDRIELDIKDIQIELGRVKEGLKTKIDKDILKNLE